MNWALADGATAAETAALRAGYGAVRQRVASLVYQVVPARQIAGLPGDEQAVGDNVLMGDRLQRSGEQASAEAVSVVEGLVGYPLVARPVWSNLSGAGSGGSGVAVARLPLPPARVDRLRYVGAEGRRVDVGVLSFERCWMESRSALGLYRFDPRAFGWSDWPVFLAGLEVRAWVGATAAQLEGLLPAMEFAARDILIGRGATRGESSMLLGLVRPWRVEG